LTRASLYFYNTREDIDALTKSLRRVKGFFDRAA
jgi:selenocysteine lyase/cysteine desulfurase